jgi:hypothetical protein
MDAVAADGDGRHRLAVRRAGGIVEAQANARVVDVVDRDAGMARDDAIGAEPFADGVEQDRLQVGAVDRQLRRVVAGPASGRLAVDVLAEAVEERRLARHDGDALEVGEDAERFERRARVRQDVDADAERPDLGGRFVDPAGDARAVQCQRERQAADAGADDGDLVASARCAKLGHDRAGAYGAAKISPQREALLVPCAS